jgi:hypothetical protein
MPLLRYFLYVGGSLLGLLLFANAAFVTVPLPSVLTSDSELPAVRIHTERKLPERVVFDTRVVRSPQAPATSVAMTRQAPAQAAALPPAVAAMSAKARVREAFAQLPPDEDASEPKMSQMATVVLPEPKMYPSKSVVKHKLAARPRVTHAPVMVAQQPHFGGFFDTWAR